MVCTQGRRASWERVPSPCSAVPAARGLRTTPACWWQRTGPRVHAPPAAQTLGGGSTRARCCEAVVVAAKLDNMGCAARWHDGRCWLLAGGGPLGMGGGGRHCAVVPHVGMGHPTGAQALRGPGTSGPSWRCMMHQVLVCGAYCIATAVRTGNTLRSCLLCTGWCAAAVRSGCSALCWVPALFGLYCVGVQQASPCGHR